MEQANCKACGHAVAAVDASGNCDRCARIREQGQAGGFGVGEPAQLIVKADAAEAEPQTDATTD